MACFVRVSYLGFPNRDSFERIPNKIPFVNSFPLFLSTLSFIFKFDVTNVPQISSRITLYYLYQHAIPTLTYPIVCLVCDKQPGPSPL